MSDQVATLDTPPAPVAEADLHPAPATMVVPSPQGGFIGVMHHGGAIRSFWGESLDRIKTLFSKVGIAEFGLPQDRADEVAQLGIDDHQAREVEGADVNAAHEELAKDHDALAEQVKKLQGDLSASKQQASDLQTKLDAANAECARLEQENTRLSEQLNAAGTDPGSTAQSQQQTGDGSAGAAGDPGPSKEA